MINQLLYIGKSAKPYEWSVFRGNAHVVKFILGSNKKLNKFKKLPDDVDLVKQDLINHFNIRKGEKLMQPNFGSIIWGMLFEPLPDHVNQVIVDDVSPVVGYDPRL